MTIIVAFANHDEKTVPSISECQSRKHYAFNVDDDEDIQEGDVLDLGYGYDNDVRVIKVLPHEFKYYNIQSSALSNYYTSTLQRPIKRIKLGSQDETVVYASKR